MEPELTCAEADAVQCSTSETTAFALPHTLDMSAASDLHDKLKHLLATGRPSLDASGVGRMSTPCAQLLLAAGRASEKAGTGLKIINASDVFLDSVVELGLQGEFSNWTK